MVGTIESNICEIFIRLRNHIVRGILLYLKDLVHK